MGLDLSFRDLEIPVRILQGNGAKASASLVPEKRFRGRRCHVVQLVPHNADFPHSRYELWFDADDLLLWRVDVFDLDGHPCKRVRLRDYVRIQNYATAREAEVANVQYGTRTLFRITAVGYDTGVPDELFSLAAKQRL